MALRCSKVRKKLISYLTRQLQEKEHNAIAEHLQLCPRCQREADELRMTWNTLERFTIDQPLPELTSSLLERTKREEKPLSLLERLEGWATRIPAPAVYALSLLFSILPGVFLGKNLYIAFKVPHPSYVAEITNSGQEEIPLDLFSEFPYQSLGTVYLNMLSDSVEEDK